MSITAVVLSAKPYTRTFPGVDEVLVHRSIITDASQLLEARFDAIGQVTTPFFFFLDDDDDLPPNLPEVLTRCVLAGVAMAYTDELVRHPDGRYTRGVAGPYSQQAHLRQPQLVHHLVLCRTHEAQRAIKELPRGHYCPNFLLYWALARPGAKYVPEVGYIWNKGDGMHTWPSISQAQMRAALWCKAHP